MFTLTVNGNEVELTTAAGRAIWRGAAENAHNITDAMLKESEPAARLHSETTTVAQYRTHKDGNFWVECYKYQPEE